MQNISTIDIIAQLWFMLCWAGYSYIADHLSKTRGSLLVVINHHRLNWMRRMLKRDIRMVDSTLIGNLSRSISFFASTTIFILLGLFTLRKYHEEASEVLQNI